LKVAGRPFPAQEPTPDLGVDTEQFGDGVSVATVHVSFTPPDARHERRYPETLVELEGVEEIGALQVAAVRVRPVQYDPRQKAFLFYPKLRYRLKFDRETARKRAAERNAEQNRVGVHYAEVVAAVLQQKHVFVAKDIYWPGFFFLEELPHVIITDNYSWPESVDRGDGTTRPPSLSERGAALAGDLVAEFERLAEWRTSRGMRSRVFTLSQIVGGELGDFTQGGFARDLQEVVRNFVKHAHSAWDTLYLLLAGDVNVVPMRHLTGCSTYSTIGCGRRAENPPPQHTCHFIATTSVVKLRPAFSPRSSDPLSTMHGGLRIPFDREAGPGRLGWYYTTEVELTTKNEGFTRLPSGQSSRFVIVEGPGAVIDDDYYWLRDVNSIPSDFYYASVSGSGYSRPGKHDFDGNNNNLYGQYHWNGSTEVSLDQVDFWPDVHVGRASVVSGAQAKAFVDKILTYEALETANGNGSVDTSYLQKVLYASAYWGREFQTRQSDTTAPPAESRFTHVGGAGTTKVRTSFDLTLSGSVPSHRLVARFASAQVAIPYDTAASEGRLGWYFATSDAYSTQSATPTRFVKVLGPESDIDPSSFFWDPTGLELSADEKEDLRSLMNGWYPAFSSVERHYEDYFDLASPPPIVPLESSTVRAALDNGVHFASLSGHGSPGGCCDVSAYPAFANDGRFFVMFANSCSTARPDGTSSLGEVATFQANGGAVGYVGNTRYGWIGIGDNYEEFFWEKLRTTGRLGPAAGFRLATGGVRQLWTAYTQTLFGDPAMSVWTAMPSLHEVSHAASAAWGGTVSITVRKLGSAVAGHRVTLLGGWSDSAHRPRVFATKTTNSFGQASFSLPATGTPLAEVRVIVTQPNFKPYVGAVAITS
jgi:hypothetical protein